MRPRAAEDPMQNTWSIGRTWKPREGWSRPVLMVERQPTSTRPRGCVAQDPAGPREGAQGARSSHAHDQSTATASIVRSPNRHTPAGNPRFPADNPRFAAAMAQERRPVPFRTRKLRPGTAMVLHPTGCGRVARRRIQRWTFWSSPLGDSRKVPFLFSWGFPPGATPRKPPFFCFAGQPAGARCPGCRKACPVSGRLGLFRASKGNFCYSTKTSGEQIFFRNVLLTRYMIRFSEYGLWNGIGKDGNDVPEHRSAACTM